MAKSHSDAQGSPTSKVPGGVKVELAISCSNLRNRDHFSRSDPVCIAYMKSRGNRKWTEIGRTECVENTFNPEWSKTFVIDFFFEEKQHIKFAVYDWDHESDDIYDQDPLGTCDCTLAEIISTGKKFDRGLSPYRHTPGDCGVISIMSEEQRGSKDKIIFELTGSNLDKKDLFTESDPFYTISKVNPDGTDTLVHRSEWIRDNANPEWKKTEIDAQKLCNGDWNRPLKFEIFDWDANGMHDFIGEFTTSLEQMANGESFQIVTWDVINHKKKAKKGDDYLNSGIVILKSIEIIQDTTFLDYVRGGLRLHFIVAVDFTLSNLDPTDPRSLHYVNEESRESPYSIAIRSIGEIYQEYNYDKQFLALGFGGKINGKTSHCFPLNGDVDNPYCRGIEGVVDAYYNSLNNVQLSDPTCFAPVIDYVRSIAQDMQDGKNYVGLLIITDGGIADMEETKKLLVQHSNLPLSLVLVGIGKGDMKNMNVLDGDSRTLSYNGVKSERDTVQFIELSNYLPLEPMDSKTFHTIMDAADAKYYLAKDVLAEIPYQVVEYMEKNGFLPGVPEVSLAQKMYQ